MGSNIAARAATAGELVKFRGPGQYTRLGLAIQAPETVYTARINQSFTTLDGVAELTYDTGSGTLADVLPGMTVYVGTSAGARDKGTLRVRKTPTATVLYINQVSDIAFADNDYLTVVNAFALWPRDINVVGETTFMDFDVAFTAYYAGIPVPRIGPVAAVLHLVDGSVTFSPPDPTGSACLDGETIVSYLYDAPGAATTSDMGTATPSWTYDAAGTYRWSCTITDSAGRTATSYRWIFVDPDPVQFNLDTCYGDWQSGYWQFSVTMFAGATTADIAERALVVLYAEEEIYNGVSGSIGRIAGYENILCVGWIDGESITRDPDAGTVQFTVRGAGYWLGKMRAFPFELQDTSSAPANWKQIEEMTVDKALAHLLTWTSTATSVMDCYFTGDTNRIKVITQPSGSLLDQLNAIALNTVFAKPQVNNLGQMHIEIDQQLMDTTTRAALPVVMDITSADWTGDLDLQRNTSPRTALVDFEGASAYDGSAATKMFSYAPGQIPKMYGAVSSYNNYLFADQAECNRLSGALLAMENNEFEPLDIELSANNRLFDLAPRMAATISLQAGDTPRGITLTARRMIPRRVEFDWDKEHSVCLTNVSFEFETTGTDGTTNIPLMISDGLPDLDIDIGDFGGFGFVDFPNLDLGDWLPDDIPGDVETPCNAYTFNFFSSNWDKNLLVGDDPTKLTAKCYFPCKLRSTFVDSTLEIRGYWEGDAGANYHVYGIKGGSRVITATVTQSGGQTTNIATFSPISDLEVDGFEIELDAGSGSLELLTPGSILATGTVDATDMGTIAIIPVTVGNVYCLEATGGPWRANLLGTNFRWTFRWYMTQWSSPGGENGIGYTTLSGYMDDYGPEALAGERIGSSNYGRVYFQATTTQIQFWVSDFNDYLNDGTLGYVLRSTVNLAERRITLGPLTIKNVCAI